MRLINHYDSGQNQFSQSLLTGECFADFFEHVIAQYGENTAIHYRHNTDWCSLTFTELKHKVDSLLAWFAAENIPAQAHIAIISESRSEWPVVLFAAWLHGAIVVPLDEKMSAAELNTAVNAMQPALIAISPSAYALHRKTLAAHSRILIMDMQQPHAEQTSLASLAAVVTAPAYHRQTKQETVLIASTSSTSGDRKGVMLSWENLSHQITALGSCFVVGQQNMFLSVLPLHHMLELSCGLLTVFSKGAQVCYLGSILPDEILRTIAEKSVTHMVAVPILSDMLCRRMQQHEKAGHELKLTLDTLIIGGAQLNSDNVKYLAGHNIDLLQGYGLTEASPVVSLNLKPALKPDSIGQPLPSVEIRFNNSDANTATGEILVKGPNVMAGYFNDHELTQTSVQDGWLHTGDIGYQDEEGYLYITGRLKNIIVLPSGKNVSSEEVEAHVLTNPLVKEVYVTGLRLEHAQLKQETEQICALVVPEEVGAENRAAILKESIMQHCQQLSAYKRPQHILVCDHELPKTATGKIKRQAAAIIARELISKHPE
jgi:long-chain acyl-CoA synthetase